MTGKQYDAFIKRFKIKSRCNGKNCSDKKLCEHLKQIGISVPTFPMMQHPVIPFYAETFKRKWCIRKIRKIDYKQKGEIICI